RPLQGIPTWKTGGEGGLEGLMDVVLHPRFSENRWVYFTYHKPAPDGDGATTLGRGTWTGTALTDVRDIFESGATGTEASRIVFGRDGMIYMTISAPGSGPQIGRSHDTDDYDSKDGALSEERSI